MRSAGRACWRHAHARGSSVSREPRARRTRGGARARCWTPGAGRPGGLPGGPADPPGRDRRDRSGTRTGRTTWPAWLGRDLAGADWPTGRPATWPPGRAAARTRRKGMVVVPASTAACAGIAIGLSKDLLQRAAEVNLKERRPHGGRAARDAGDPQPPGAPDRAARCGRGGAAGQPRLLRRRGAGDRPAIGRLRGRQGAGRARRAAHAVHAGGPVALNGAERESRLSAAPLGGP